MLRALLINECWSGWVRNGHFRHETADVLARLHYIERVPGKSMCTDRFAQAWRITPRGREAIAEFDRRVAAAREDRSA